jgi:hypothetical protein
LIVSRAPLLVGGWAVEGGDGDVVEAEIDAKLRGVVDKVVEEHLTEGLRARAVGYDLVAVEEGPWCGEGFVGGCGDGLATSCCAFVELVETGFAGLKDEGCLRARGLGEVHAVVEDDVGAEEGEGGAVYGEFAERHGFVVTPPVVFAFGDALEGAASVGDFDVVVLEENFGDGHVAP